MSQNCLVYAIDGNESYQALVMQSAASARSRSPRIPIRVCVFGPISRPLRSFARTKRIELIARKPAAGSLKSALKWFALTSASDCERVITLDADTVFFDAPEELFSRHRVKDFYGQVEFATKADLWRGTEFIPKRIDDRKMRRLRRKINSRDLPVFSSSVMVFNHGTHRRVVERLPSFMDLFQGFKSGRLDYPCREPFITEEVCGSLILGLSPRISCGSVRKDTVTHYHLWRAQGKRGTYGTLMHIGNSEILNWLRDKPGIPFSPHLSLCFKLRK